MNFNFNNRSHKIGLGQITPRGVDSRRTILADARTAGRREPTVAASTGVKRMGIESDRYGIYSGSLTAIDGDRSRLLELLSSDIRPFQTLGTHQCQLKPPPVLGDMKWMDIKERTTESFKHETQINNDDETDKTYKTYETDIEILGCQIRQLEKERLEQEKNLKERLEQLDNQERIMEAKREQIKREEAGQAEQEELETEKLDKQEEKIIEAQKELERESEKIRIEVLEKERLENERLENERLENERLENERLEKERLEKERLEKERLEKERLEKERLENERLEKERLENERLENERLEKERLENERLENERLENERLEKERLENERLENERLENERLEKEREKMTKDVGYEIEVRKKQLHNLEKSITTEKARRERVSERSNVEVYLFSCYHSHVLDFVIKQYQKLFPSASIKICDNHTLTPEEENKVREYGCRIIMYGEKDKDLDYDTLSKMYNTIWRENENQSWVIIAPADTVVNISQKWIQELNDVGDNFIGIDNYTMVSRSTKKDLSDIQLKTVSTGYKNGCDTILCFNKSACPTIEYDVKAQTVAIKENEEKISMHHKTCNSYSYVYMGLAFYVARVRQIYARQVQWRENKYAGCVSRDINSISAEILSLPPTTYMQNMK